MWPLSQEAARALPHPGPGAGGGTHHWQTSPCNTIKHLQIWFCKILLQVIKIYTLISSFMPAISALSGNLGLQASSNTIRGLGTGMCWNSSVILVASDSFKGHIGKSNYLSNMRRELRSGLVTASLLSSVLAAVAVIWSFTDKDNASILSTWGNWSE